MKRIYQHHSTLMFNLNLLVFAIGLASRALAFEYPQNLSEQRYIESVFEQIPVDLDLDETLAKLEGELKIQLELANDEKHSEDETKLGSGAQLDASDESATEARKLAKRHANLLNSYLEASNVTQSKCADLASLSDYVMLAKLHNNEPETSLEKFLKHFIVEQALLCKPGWQLKFQRHVTGINRRTMRYANSLLGGMVTYYTDEEREPIPSRPFPWDHMRKAMEEVPPIPILAYMQMVGYLTEGVVDEALFDECYPRYQFRDEYNDSILKLCKNLDGVIGVDIELFEFIFNKLRAFDERLLETNYFNIQADESKVLALLSGGNHLEWYSIGSICKRIIRSYERGNRRGGQDTIYDKALHKLTYEPGFQNIIPMFKEFIASRFKKGN